MDVEVVQHLVHFLCPGSLLVLGLVSATELLEDFLVNLLADLVVFGHSVTQPQHLVSKSVKRLEVELRLVYARKLLEEPPSHLVIEAHLSEKLFCEPLIKELQNFEDVFSAS